jgi:hypothetical protein
MRVAATLPVWKRFTGRTPGRLFQMAASRSGGQAAIKSASSCRLLKLWKRVAVVAAASSGVANATISFCSLMVKVVILVLLFVALVAVNT